MEGPRWDWGTSLPIPWLNVDPTKQVKNCLVRSMLIPFRNWLLPFLCLSSWWQLKYFFMFTPGKWSSLTSFFFRGEKPPTSYLWTLHTKFSDQTWSYNLFYLIQFGKSKRSLKMCNKTCPPWNWCSPWNFTFAKGRRIVFLSHHFSGANSLFFTSGEYLRDFRSGGTVHFASEFFRASSFPYLIGITHKYKQSPKNNINFCQQHGSDQITLSDFNVSVFSSSA